MCLALTIILVNLVISIGGDSVRDIERGYWAVVGLDGLDWKWRPDTLEEIVMNYAWKPIPDPSPQ